MSGRGRFCRDERGSGTIWVIVMIMLVASFAIGAAAVGGAVVARHRASSAADFAALAAADALARAEADPCSAASRVAARYGGELTGCTVDGMTVYVVVDMAAGGLTGPSYRATVRARAGPG